MAGESCSLTCNVRDPRTGGVKVSALWDDLAKFFKGDRRQAVTHYFLTKDSNFLRENSDVLEFDVDGEVTIASLKKALERGGEYSNLSNARTLEHLNKEIKAGRYNYSEALDNVLKFNKSNQFREGFMATLKREPDGMYSVKVVERNPQSEYELADHVQNKLMTDAVRLLLQNQGLSVDFLENPSYVLKYSTYNDTAGPDGLTAVAQVMDGMNTSTETAEVAGHFIVGAMEGNPLINRLLNQLTPEVQEAIFKDRKSNLYREDFVVSSDSAKEAAGILVGRSLIAPFREAASGSSNKLTKVSSAVPKTIKFILSKIKNYVQKVLGTYTPDKVGKMVQEAKETASTISQGYLNTPERADVSNIFNTPETFATLRSSKYLSDAVRENVGAFKETMGYLKESARALRDIVGRSEGSTNRDIYKKIQKLHKTVITQKVPMLDVGTFAERASIEGMVYTIEGITQILDTDIRTLLDSIQPSDRTDSQIRIVENARNMRTVESFVRNTIQLYLVMSEKVDRLNATEKVQFKEADGNQVVESLREALARLSEVLIGNEEAYLDTQNAEQKVPGLKRLMELKTRQVCSDFLQNVLGREYIERNAGVIWRQEGSRVKLMRSDKIKGYNEIKMKDWLTSMDEDISLIDRYLKSCADCGDLITAVGYKITRNANMQADRITERFADSVETLYAQMQDIFGTTDCNFLYETMLNEDGQTVKTGNLIAPVKYGEWEADRQKFKEELKAGFGDYIAEQRKKAYENNKNNPEFVFKLSDFQRSVLWHNYADPLWQRWNDEHCIEDPSAFGSKKMIPNPVMYHSEQWDALFDTKNPSLSEQEKAERVRRFQWYNALMELKDEMDAILPVNSTVRWRAPQFTGNTYHRFRNLRTKMQNSRAALGNALRRKAQDLVIVRQDEAYLFGSNNEFNEIEEDPLENNMYFEKEKKDRLPLFGINKLKNMDDLSTDLFGNMLRYASMASTFGAFKTIVDALELFSDAIKHRKVEGIVESERKKESRAHARYMKFLQNNVYGIAITPPRWDRKGTLRKLAGKLSGMSSALYLGGNVAGGVVNTGTGMIEIFKEASTGEFFNTADVVKAHKLYYDGLLSGDGYFSSFTNMFTNPQRPMDKNNLWIRHWAITNDSRKFYRKQRYDTNVVNNRLFDWFGHCLWLPYSSGDHYMQCIPFYALGIHEKVYDRGGHLMNLMDAYEVVGNEDIHAIGDESTVLGKTPKLLRLKDNIFRSTADIDKYETVQGMINKTADFFDSHPNVRGTSSLALDFFSDEEKRLLEDEDMNVPTTVKQLETLRNALTLKAGELKYNENDESIFMDKCRNITNRLHGIYNTEDKTTMHQNFFGNLFMAMKGYALGYINRNFAPNSYNLTVNKSTEGSFQTLGKVLAYYFSGMDGVDNWKALTEALMLCVPGASLFTLSSGKYNNRLSADMLKMGFSEHQFYNMRRMGINLLVIETLFLLGMLTAKGGLLGPKKDDDDEEVYGNPAVGVAYYLTQRWNREQNAYVTPWGMWDEAGSLMSIPVGFSGLGKMWEISQLYARTKLDQMGGNPDMENSDLYYQSSKKDIYEEGDEKWKKKANRYIPYYRSWYVLEHPYDAAANFEYGRKVRK